LLFGSGCFKGNLAAQVATLYPVADKRVASAFQIYTLSVQIAVIFSPLVCGTLGEKLGWHWGFGAAGVGMLLGLLIYWRGRRHLPPDQLPAREAAAKPRVRLTPVERRTVWLLIALVPLQAMLMAYNQQGFNAYLVWAESSLQRTFFGLEAPITWLLSLGSIISTASIPVSLLFWRWWSRRWTEPNDLNKMAFAGLVAAMAPLMLALASTLIQGSGERASILWAISAEIINDLAFANIYPVGMALFSRAAPRSLAGFMVAVFFLHLFLANMLVGRLGGLLEQMPAVAFWSMHAGIVLGASVILIIARKPLIRALIPESAQKEGRIPPAAAPA
jgi:POT family proton-dependent oligopeptide transporter